MSWFSHGSIMASAFSRGHVRTLRRRRRRQSRTTRRPYSKYWVDRDMELWFTMYFSDIGHSCYDQLTPVKTRYMLTSITWPYPALKFTAFRSPVFLSWSLIKGWFSIESRASVRFFVLLNTGQDCSEVRWRQGLNEFSFAALFSLCFVYMVIIKTQNRRPNKQ